MSTDKKGREGEETLFLLGAWRSVVVHSMDQMSAKWTYIELFPVVGNQKDGRIAIFPRKYGNCNIS